MSIVPGKSFIVTKGKLGQACNCLGQANLMTACPEQISKSPVQ